MCSSLAFFYVLHGISTTSFQVVLTQTNKIDLHIQFKIDKLVLKKIDPFTLTLLNLYLS